MTARELDGLDRAIISQLQQDGRRPFRAIARSLGVGGGHRALPRHPSAG